MFNDYELINQWLKEHDVDNYIIQKDTLKVDVNGLVCLENHQLTQLPVQFGQVLGNFSCSHNRLMSLKGVPEHVLKNFDASYNHLSTVDFLPISQQVHLIGNPLKDLNFFSQFTQPSFQKLTLNITSTFELHDLALLKNIQFDEIYLYFEGHNFKTEDKFTYQYAKGYYYVIQSQNKPWLIDHIISHEQMKKIDTGFIPKVSQRKIHF
jgi:hypothetical protein